MASLLSIQTNRSVNYVPINVLKKEYRTFSDFTVSIPYAEHICKSVLFINLNGDSFWDGSGYSLFRPEPE
ncbi:MAG: hypothetical protein C4518_19140 [Desulfobacteraceae bacterium]|nr:MAG: hypothetical protein C4518_19140 [Desulfobacteraceae bacterium]